jgi:hypothetical protein
MDGAECDDELEGPMWAVEAASPSEESNKDNERNLGALADRAEEDGDVAERVEWEALMTDEVRSKGDSIPEDDGGWRGGN